VQAVGLQNEIRANGLFATTHWSVVLAAGDGSPESLNALETLCRGYWYPIYAHVRRRGHSPEDAKDLTQEFFASLLRHESFAGIRQEKGRFRTFLLASLNYFLSDQSDRLLSAKRGAGKRPIELDALEAEERYRLEPSTEETPDKAFDRRWAAELLERSLKRLCNEQAEQGKIAQFESLKTFLMRDVLPGEYHALAPQLGLSPNATAAAVRRLRLRLREIALSEAMQTLGSFVEAEDELRSLLS
jgi:RNA polymerase sigma-70 factor (ECF subfamily)